VVFTINGAVSLDFLKGEKTNKPLTPTSPHIPELIWDGSQIQIQKKKT